MGKGIDNIYERDTFTYRPDIRHQVKEIKTPDIDLQHQDQDRIDQDTHIEDYVNGLMAIDSKFDDISDILRVQQEALSLEIDPEKFPQVAEGISCLSGGKQNTEINYGIYDAAYGIVHDRIIRQIYTEHPVRGVSDVKELRSRRDRLNKNISDKIFNQAVRKLGAEIVRAIAKVHDGKIGVAGVSVGSAIARLLRKLADAMDRRNAIRTSDLNAAADFSTAQFNFDESGDNDTFSDGHNLNDDIADLGDVGDTDCLRHAQVVYQYVIDSAKEDDLNNEVNVDAFLERQAIEQARVVHEQTKSVVATGLENRWKMEDDKLELVRRLNESGLSSERAWLGADVDTLRIETRSSSRLFNDSIAVDDLADYGYKKLLETLNAIDADLRLWLSDPVVLCCFIKSATVAAKIDRSLIESMRFALIFRKKQLDRNLDTLITSGTNWINDILQGLAARLIASLDIVISGYVGRLRRAAEGKLNTTGCIPWDQLVGEVFSTFAAMEQDLLAMLSQYTAKLRIGDRRLAEQHIIVQEKRRVNFIIRLFNVLLDVIELNTICSEGQTAIKLDPRADWTTLSEADSEALAGFISSDDGDVSDEELQQIFEEYQGDS